MEEWQLFEKAVCCLKNCKNNDIILFCFHCLVVMNKLDSFMVLAINIKT